MSDKKVFALSNEETAVQTLVVIDNSSILPENSYNSINEWYIKPLMDMGERQGFLVLMILLPLYEAHLKVNGHIEQDENFTQGHQVFRVIGRDLGISMDEAFDFWRCFRNGLLHTAIPNEVQSFPYKLRGHGPKVERENGEFYINPFALRDHLIGIIKADLKKWKRHYPHFPVTYVP